jgi:histidinol-phosphate aminotransferase
MTASQTLASRYPDATEEDLCRAIARHHGVAREQVVLGCGSGEILKMADAAFLSAGRTVVVAHPTFEAVLMYSKATKAEAVTVPLTADYRHDLPRMAGTCDARTGMVYVCNPNNPTGTIVSSAEVDAFLAKVPASAIVLLDEAYHHFVEDESYASGVARIAQHPNLVVVRTFSKIHGLAGMRLGYAVASVENANRLRDEQIYSNANAAVIAAGVTTLDDAAHVEKQRALLNGSRDFLCAELAKDGRRFIPSHANFVMVEIGSDVTPVIEAFKAKGILVGRKFPTLETWLRISIGTQSETEAFLAALRQLVPARKVA